MMKKKSICTIWILLAMVLCLSGSSPALLRVKAQEPVLEERNQIMTAQSSIEAKAEPEEQASVVHSYETGDSVFVTGETADGWYQITYQDVVGYVPVSSLTEMEINVEDLDAEFSVQEEEGKLVVEVVERNRAEARRAKIWGSIIAVLVAGIFALGIFSAIKANQSEDEAAKREKTKYHMPDEADINRKIHLAEAREEKEDRTEQRENTVSEVIDLDQE